MQTVMVYPQRKTATTTILRVFHSPPKFVMGSIKTVMALPMTRLTMTSMVSLNVMETVTTLTQEPFLAQRKATQLPPV